MDEPWAEASLSLVTVCGGLTPTRIQNNSARITLFGWAAQTAESVSPTVPQVRRLRTIVVWPLLLLLMRLAAWRPQHPKHSKTATPRPAPAQIFFNLFATTSATHFAKSTE